MRDKQNNEALSDILRMRNKKIELKFGDTLEWEILEQKRDSRIKAEQPDNVFDRDQREDMVQYMMVAICRLEKAIHIPLRDAKNVLEQVSQ